jgi:hypothetical protein
MTPDSTREKPQKDQLLILLYKKETWLPRPSSLTTDAPPEEGDRGAGRRWYRRCTLKKYVERSLLPFVY